MVLPSASFKCFPVVVVATRAAGSLARLLVRAEREPGELADRIRRARDHPQEMRRMGSNARHRGATRYRCKRHLTVPMEPFGLSGDRAEL
jgi:hypothetical protein